jgi:hypothetical protein
VGTQGIAVPNPHTGVVGTALVGMSVVGAWDGVLDVGEGEGGIVGGVVVGDSDAVGVTVEGPSVVGMLRVGVEVGVTVVGVKVHLQRLLCT